MATRAGCSRPALAPGVRTSPATVLRGCPGIYTEVRSAMALPLVADSLGSRGHGDKPTGSGPVAGAHHGLGDGARCHGHGCHRLLASPRRRGMEMSMTVATGDGARTQSYLVATGRK
jgi:hypothetical protein